MKLVPDDRSAHRSAPPLVLRVRLREPFLLRKEIFGGQTAVLEEPEGAAAKLIGACFRDSVDDGAGRAAVLRVVLSGNDLELLYRLDRRPRLRPRALADHVVVIV